MSFPVHRGRRLRRTPALRALAQETRLAPAQLVAPLFVRDRARRMREPIASMPGHARLSPDLAAARGRGAGRRSASARCCCSASPTTRTPRASAPGIPTGPVPRRDRAHQARRRRTCRCGPTSACASTPTTATAACSTTAAVDNDATLPLLARAAVAYAVRRRRRDRAVGHDGRPRRRDPRGARRRRLRRRAIVSYAAKYASAFYGPFREAAGSTPQQRRPARLPDGSAQRPRGGARGPGRRRRRRGHGDGEAGAALPRRDPRRSASAWTCRSRPTRCRASSRCCTPPPSAAGSICRARCDGDRHRAAPRRRRRRSSPTSPASWPTTLGGAVAWPPPYPRTDDAPTPTTSAATWFERARQVTPGGVHSPVRAFAAMRCDPLAIVVGARRARARRRPAATLHRLHRRLGTGAARPRASRGRAGGRRAPPPRPGLRPGLAARGRAGRAHRRARAGLRDGPLRRDRHRGDDERGAASRAPPPGGAPSSSSPARYHGHADMFLVSAGSGAATFGVPDSPGVTPGAAAGHADRALQRSAPASIAASPSADGGVAAVIVEPVVGNMGCVPPADGLPRRPARALHPRTARVLIFDEVMTGFRVARGGAAERYGVTPDLVTLGKIVGGGLPLAAFGGQRVADAAGGAGGPGLPGRHLRGASAGGGRRPRHARRHRRARRTSTTSLEAPRRPAAAGRSTAAAARRRAGHRCSASARCGRCSSRRTPVASWDDAAAVDREALRAVLPRHAGARRPAAAVGVRVGVPLGGARRRRHRRDHCRGRGPPSRRRAR